MSGFDINNPIDFAQKVLGAGAGVLANFTGTDPSQWDIQEGSYNGVVFHVFESKQDWSGAVDQIQDAGGRRLVKYMYPYQDGQTTDDLGRAGETFTFNILLHGSRYKSGYIRLFRELQDSEPGLLVHPFRGQLRAKMEDFTIVHESKSRKAMLISLTMVEHNFNAGALEDQAVDNSVKSWLQKALEAFQEIEATLLKVEGTLIFIQAVKNDLLALLESFKGDYSKTLGQMNKSFNNGTSDDIPGLLPTNQGGTQNEDGSQSSTTFQTAASPSDPFQSVPVEGNDETSAPLTVKELEKEVNDRRTEINNILDIFNSSTDAALEFNEDVINFKGIAIRLQRTLEAGKASSRQSVIDFVTPRLMTIREVAFENNLKNDRVVEIEDLNPDLQSFNFIEKDTLMKIPT